MSCSACSEIDYDYGFDLPDTRCYYMIDGLYAHISIYRKWFDCECGMGTDFNVYYQLDLPKEIATSFGMKDTRFLFEEMEAASTFVKRLWPEAKRYQNRVPEYGHSDY